MAMARAWWLAPPSIPVRGAPPSLAGPDIACRRTLPCVRTGKRVCAVRASGAMKVSAAGTTAVAGPSRREADELLAWLAETGVVSGAGAAAKPAPVEQGLGLVAQRDVRKGEEVVQVPRRSWITLDTAKESRMGRFLEGQRPWVVLALYLIGERADPASKWRAYIRSLPQALESTLFWTDEELMELQGTQLLGSTLSYKEYVESEFKQVQEQVMAASDSVFDANIFTLEAFFWAFGILRSRTFSPLTGKNLALVPLADLVNHGSRPGVEAPSWELQKGTGIFGSQDMLLIRAASSFQAGEEIVMEYGTQKGNGPFALEYGFVVKQAGSSVALRSTLRDTFTLTLEIPASDSFFDDKADVAEINGLGESATFELLSGQGPSEEMLAFLRLMVIDGPDAFLLEALFRDSIWDHILLPVSRENEEGMCKSILDGCRAALAAYHTTIDEDVRLLEEGTENSRLEIAAVVRLGEKRVLEELQSWFEAHLARLDRLEYYAERRLKDLGLVDDKGDMTPWVFGGE